MSPAATQDKWDSLLEGGGETKAPEPKGDKWDTLLGQGRITAFSPDSWRKSMGTERTAKSWVTGFSDYEDLQTVLRMNRITGELADTGAVEDEGDLDWMQDIISHQQREKTIGAKAQGLVMDSVVFMQDFVLGGKVLGTAAGRVASQAALKKMTASWLSKEYALSMAKAGIRSAATVGAAEILKKGAGEAGLPMAARTEVSFERNMYQQRFNIGEDEAGELRATLSASLPDASVALYQAGLGTFIEGFTEGIGGHLMKLGPMQRVSVAQHTIAEWFFGKGGTLKGLMKRIASKTGWDGVVEEWMEERAGSVMEGMAPGSGVSMAEALTPDFEQWAAEGVGFWGMGSVMHGAQSMISALPQPTDEQLEEISKLPKEEADKRMLEEFGMRPAPEAEEEAPDEAIQAEALQPPPELLERVQAQKGTEGVTRLRGAQTELEAAFVEQELEERETNVFWGDLPEDIPAMLVEAGTVVLNESNQEKYGAESLGSYLAHEGLHDSAAKEPLIAGRVINLIMATEWGQEARAAYEAKLVDVNAARAKRGEQLLPTLEEAVLNEEGAARLAEEAWLPLTVLLENDPQALRRAIEQEPKFWERVLDAVVKMARVVGIKLDSARIRRIRRALKAVGQEATAKNAEERADVLSLLAGLMEMRSKTPAPSRNGWEEQPRSTSGQFGSKRPPGDLEPKEAEKPVGEAQEAVKREPVDDPDTPDQIQEDAKPEEEDPDVEITGRFALPPSESGTEYQLIPREVFEGVNLEETAWAGKGIRSSWDTFRRKMEDYLLPVQRLEEEIEKSGGKVPVSVRAAAQLMPGITQRRVNEVELAVKRMSKIMRAQKHWGLTPEKALKLAGDVSYAWHAEEANQAGMDKDPGGEWDQERNPFSGMPLSEARGILNEHAEKPGMEEVMQELKAMNQRTRNGMQADGLQSEETIEAWQEMFENYVPLRTADTDPGTPPHPRGRGFQVGGIMVHSRGGRRSHADNPITFSILQARNFAVLGEKNRVGRAMWDMLQDENNKGLVSWDRVTRPEGAEDWAPPKDTFKFKLEGEEHIIRMASKDVNNAMKGLTFVPVTGPLRIAAKYNRYLGKMVTQYNPEFVLSNFARDIQAAMLNIAKEDAEGARRTILKSIPGAWRAIYARQRTGAPVQSDMGELYERYLDAGGLIGFAQEVNYASLHKDLAKEFTRGSFARTMQAGLEYMGDLNAAVEQGTRLSVFRAMVDAGKTDAEAAKISREITVDFNRRGEWTGGLNAYKMFLGANIQGTSQLLRNLHSSPAIRKMAAGLVGFSASLAVANYLLAGDDDDGENRWLKKEDWLKERNLIFPAFWSENPDDQITVPAMYGFNVFHVLGTSVADAGIRMYEGTQTKTEALKDITGGLARSAWNAFSPVTEYGWMQMASPTVALPFVQIRTNETWSGNPISPENAPWGVQEADSELAYGSVSTISDKVAKWLNRHTGGSKFRSGAIDISPESLDHLFDSWLGGVGQVARRTVLSAQKPEEAFPNDIPVIRRFYNERRPTRDVSVLYRNIQEVERTQAEYGAEEGSAAKSAYRQRRGGVMRLKQSAKTARSRMKSLRDRIKKLDSVENTDAIKKRRRALEEQRRQTALRFTKTYLAADRKDKFGE